MVKITGYTSSPMQRNENDWVSYIDSGGYNHSKEGLNYFFDFDSTQRIQNEYHIDWEQRRYEIAKDVMCANICSPVIPGIDPNPSLEEVSRHACAAADALITALKKEHA